MSRIGARTSLRLIVPLASTLLLSMALLAGTVVSEQHTRGLLVKQARARLALEAELLARASASAMLEGYPELTLQPILRDLLRGRDDLATAMVLDRDGRILAHPDTRRIGQQHAVPDAGSERVGEARIREAGASFVAVMPIHHASGSVLGQAIVEMPRAPLESALAAARVRQWLIAIALACASAALTFALMSRLLRPVTRLREGLERIGRGDLDTRLALHDGTELGLLADTLDDMAGRLSAAQKSQIERERLAAELEAAGRIQTMLRPPGPVRRGAYEVVGHQRPATEVGGDYFDAIELPDGRLGVVIADVAGKGLAGCLVTFMLAALVRVMREHEASPRQLLLEVDRYLRPVLERGAFVTVWYGVVDPLTGQVTFASAGHLPTLVRRADGRVERFDSKSIPLGILSPQALAKGLREHVTRLEPGDALLQLTDGFTEAVRAGSDEQLGVDGVVRAWSELGADSAAHVVEGLGVHVDRWSGGAAPDDDQTVVLLRRDGGAAAPAFDPLQAATWVARARADASPLRLSADLSQLEALHPWLHSAPGLSGLPAPALDALESALYEVCANVIEHGYGCDGRGLLEVWWLQHERAAVAGDGAPVRGTFVMLERGRTFDLSAAVPADLSHPLARRKGRGLGVAMIQRMLPGVSYCADTPEGNVTLLPFDSLRFMQTLEGVPDARCA